MFQINKKQTQPKGVDGRKYSNSESKLINQKERTIQRTYKTKRWFFGKISKLNKPLAKLTKRHRDGIHINKNRNEKGDITREKKEIQKIIRSYFISLCSKQTGKSKQNG